MHLNWCNPILSSFLSLGKQRNGPRLGRQEAVNEAQPSRKISRHVEHIPTRWLCQCSYALDHSIITLSYYFSSTITQTTYRYSVLHGWPACNSLSLLFSWSLSFASKNASLDWSQGKHVGTCFYHINITSWLAKVSQKVCGKTENWTQVDSILSLSPRNTDQMLH